MPKILIVDDDKDMVFINKLALEKMGYQVTAVNDGQQALNEIRNNVPDLMIVDLTMPQMDGWRLSMKVRQDERCKNLPIIVLSGLLAEEESRPGPEEPYNMLVAKPFDVIKLAGIIKKLLDEKAK